MKKVSSYAAVAAAGLVMSLAGSAMAQTNSADPSQGRPPSQAPGGGDGPQVPDRPGDVARVRRALAPIAQR